MSGMEPRFSRVGARSFSQVETSRRQAPFRAALMRTALPFLLFASVIPAGAGDLQTITITTPQGQMKYDRPLIKAQPGSLLGIAFKNNDEMPHNIVFCLPGEGAVSDRGLEVAMEAWKLAEKGEAAGWIPQHPRVLAHSKMVPAHQTETFVLKVPDQPGDYPYVCTFPGHAMAMNGVMRVLAEGPGFTALNYKLYLGDWNRLPDFNALTPHREGPLAERKIDLKLEGMSEHFGVRFDGKVEAPEDGLYQFILASDDGSRLYVDGKQLTDNDGIHASSDLRVARTKLTRGPHEVRLDYFEQAGQEEIYLAWTGPKFSETPLSKWIHPSREGGQAEAPEQRNRGIPLAPQNGEAVMHRNSIEGSGPRSIAVGYPNGVNVCFDADQMTQSLMWRGAFLDVKQHWTDRGGGNIPPLGFGVVRLQDGPGMAVLADDKAPWPQRKEHAGGIRFLGYHLDVKRFPTFRYSMGGLTVEESYETTGDYKTTDEKLTRVLRLKGPALSGFFVRAATGNMRADAGGFRHQAGAVFTIAGGEAILRNNNELLVRPAFTNGTAEVRIGAAWVNSP
jgi:plastocyanin